MSEQQDNAIKISNPERIARVLDKICHASLPLMIRMNDAQKVAVKGRAAGVDQAGGALKKVRISSISEKGITFLTKGAPVQVEFIMMSTKVVFQSVVLEIDHHAVYVAFPQLLVSVERRKNARYACTDNLKAFLKFGAWKAKDDEYTSPPYFPHQVNIASYTSVVDLSLGGLCVTSRFPAIFLELKRGIIDDRASLMLPMSAPIPVSTEIRWIRKIKENVFLGEDRVEAFQLHFKIGLEFVTLSDAAGVALKQFMRTLSQSEAV